MIYVQSKFWKRIKTVLLYNTVHNISTFISKIQFPSTFLSALYFKILWNQRIGGNYKNNISSIYFYYTPTEPLIIFGPRGFSPPQFLFLLRVFSQMLNLQGVFHPQFWNNGGDLCKTLDKDKRCTINAEIKYDTTWHHDYEIPLSFFSAWVLSA